MKTKIKSYYLLPLISALCIILIVVYFIIPKINEINEANQNIEIEQTTKQKLEQKRVALEKLRADEVSVQSMSKNLSLALPDQKSIASLILTIENLTNQSQASISSMQISPGELIESRPKVSQNADELLINITFNGTADQIKNVTQRLYRAKRLLNMKALNIAVTEAGVNATASIIAYYKLRPETPKDVAEEIPSFTESDRLLADELDTFTAYTPEGAQN